MTAPVVVFALGNPSCGDDALGHRLAAQFAVTLKEIGQASTFEVIEDFQLQIEHALDLEGRGLVLFIDAGTGTPPPYTFRRIKPSADYGHTTHALAPEAVLQVFQQILGKEPPPAFVLCVRGESFELGDSLSWAAASHLESALKLLQQLTQSSCAEVWDGLAASYQR